MLGLVRDLGDVVSSGLKSSKYVVIILLLNNNYNQTSIIIAYLLISFKATSNSPFQRRYRQGSELSLKSLTNSTFFLSFSASYSSYYSSKYQHLYLAITRLLRKSSLSSFSCLLALPSQQDLRRDPLSISLNLQYNLFLKGYSTDKHAFLSWIPASWITLWVY